MQTRFTLTVVVLIVSLLAIGWNSCNPTPANDVVKINYQQVGACNGFNNGSGVTSAGSQRAYVVFKISTIENRESAARDFNFDPNKLYVNQSPPAFTSTRLNLAQLNPFYATSRFVAKGTTETLNGAVIAVVSTAAADGSSEANNTSYLLLYDTPPGAQGVVLVKANPSQTTWPNKPDCTNIFF